MRKLNKVSHFRKYRQNRLRFQRVKATVYKILFIFILSTLLITHYILNKFENEIYFGKCYLPPGGSSFKIMHLIITRFIIEFWRYDNFVQKIYTNDYIINGKRVMEKYLFPSLSNQRCQDFIWILKVGDKANITYIKSIIDLNNTFESVIIYEKDIKDYIRNISKGYDILITTRIDYDDKIYYDAVNDIRKAINFIRPALLYGYGCGWCFYENNNKYYEFNPTYNNNGVMSIFVSLILVLNKVNDAYNIFDLGSHTGVRAWLLRSYKSFGIDKLDYEPAIFDYGTAKFIWVRQNFSGQFGYSESIKKSLVEYKFDLKKFYGK